MMYEYKIETYKVKEAEKEMNKLAFITAWIYFGDR